MIPSQRYISRWLPDLKAKKEFIGYLCKWLRSYKCNLLLMLLHSLETFIAAAILNKKTTWIMWMLRGLEYFIIMALAFCLTSLVFLSFSHNSIKLMTHTLWIQYRALMIYEHLDSKLKNYLCMWLNLKRRGDSNCELCMSHNLSICCKSCSCSACYRNT
jgi:hypothetical protein